MKKTSQFVASPKRCVYCLEREATTKDHVPPKCFFPPDDRPNLITVPSCLECNQKFSSSADLEFQLSLTILSGQNPRAATKFQEIATSIAADSRRTAEFAERAELFWDTDESGLMLPRLALKSSGRQFQQQFVRVALALAWKQWRTLVPLDIPFEFHADPDRESMGLDDPSVWSNFSARTSVGEAFSYRHQPKPAELNHFFVWDVRFFDCVDWLIIMRGDLKGEFPLEAGDLRPLRDNGVPENERRSVFYPGNYGQREGEQKA